MFYIILSGKVSVIIPCPVEMEINMEGLFIYTIRNFDNIDWNKLLHGDSIR